MAETQTRGLTSTPASGQTSQPKLRIRVGARAVSAMRRGKAFWVLITVVLVAGGVLAAVLGARAVARSDADRQRLASHLTADDIASTLKLAIRHEEDLTVSASAFVTANPNATPLAFDTWVESVHAFQRYPELQNIGLAKFIQPSQLAAFEARMAASPLRPLGLRSTAPAGRLQIVPAGRRPYYCLAVAGMARNVASYLPVGLDYCQLIKSMIGRRDSGLTGYAPLAGAGSVRLGVETPVYLGGVLPATVAARRRAFVGWLGELIKPNVLLETALAGQRNVTAMFRYDAPFSHIQFTSGTLRGRAQRTTIPLQVGREAGLVNPHAGWTVQILTASVAGGVFAYRDALMLLVGGFILSVLIGLLLLVLGSGRTRARRLVDAKTRELSHKNRQLSELALHDTLTGLPNRALVLDRAAQMLARAARQADSVAGALFVDVDGFKRVNDELGHAAGDTLLRTVGQRLQSTVRSQDTVGRLGGDEFIVLAECAVDDATLDILAERLTETLRQPVELDDGRKIFSVTASIGVASGRYENPDALLRDADLALYAAKAAGKDRYTLFDTSMRAGEEGRIQLEADLERALSHEQFVLLYQPITSLSSHEVVGVEALIRWHHPTRGVIGPEDFIPLAEESGLIAPIGQWVLERACRQAAAWAAADHAISMAVNVSAYQLGRKGFAGEVQRALAASAVEPSSLTLEITETTLMRDVPAACERLQELKALGMQLAIDDFGTGYASLSHLQRMPVDILKIDRSFIAALGHGPQGRDLLQAILGIARSLSLSVIAEGIEEQSQLSILEQIGCQMAQGFLLGSPARAQDIETLLSSGARRTSTQRGSAPAQEIAGSARSLVQQRR